MIMATDLNVKCDQCGKSLDVDGRKVIKVLIGQLATGDGKPIKIQSAEQTSQAILDFCSPTCLRQYLVKVSP